MGLSVVTPPVDEPISLAEARRHCRIDHPDDDGLLTRYILAARIWAEDYTRRSFCTQTLAYTLECLPGTIILPRPPHQSISSITYVDGAGVTQTLAGSEYQTDLSRGDLAARIRPAYGKTWPVLRMDVFNAFRVQYVAGYGGNPSNVPDPIVSAMLLLIGHQYENREEVVVGTIATQIPMGVRALLDPSRDPDSAF